MRLANGQGLLHEWGVFRNCHTSSLSQPHSQFKESTIVATTYLEASGCMVGNWETIQSPSSDVRIASALPVIRPKPTLTGGNPDYIVRTARNRALPSATRS
jgi:hypothetical protein